MRIGRHKHREDTCIWGFSNLIGCIDFYRYRGTLEKEIMPTKEYHKLLLEHTNFEIRIHHPGI
jgi:hypothetical protein